MQILILYSKIKLKKKNCEYNILYNYIFCFMINLKIKNLLNIQYLQVWKIAYLVCERSITDR